MQSQTPKRKRPSNSSPRAQPITVGDGSDSDSSIEFVRGPSPKAMPLRIGSTESPHPVTSEEVQKAIEIERLKKQEFEKKLAASASARAAAASSQSQLRVSAPRKSTKTPRLSKSLSANSNSSVKSNAQSATTAKFFDLTLDSDDDDTATRPPVASSSKVTLDDLAGPLPLKKSPTQTPILPPELQQPASEPATSNNLNVPPSESGQSSDMVLDSDTEIMPTFSDLPDCPQSPIVRPAPSPSTIPAPPAVKPKANLVLDPKPGFEIREISAPVSESAVDTHLPISAPARGYAPSAPPQFDTPLPAKSPTPVAQPNAHKIARKSTVPPRASSESPSGSSSGSESETSKQKAPPHTEVVNGKVGKNVELQPIGQTEGSIPQEPSAAMKAPGDITIPKPASFRAGRKSAAHQSADSSSNDEEEDDGEMQEASKPAEASEKATIPPLTVAAPNPVRAGRKSAAHQMSSSQSSSSEEEDNSDIQESSQPPAEKKMQESATFARIGRKSAAHQTRSSESSSSSDEDSSKQPESIDAAKLIAGQSPLPPIQADTSQTNPTQASNPPQVRAGRKSAAHQGQSSDSSSDEGDSEMLIASQLTKPPVTKLTTPSAAANTSTPNSVPRIGRKSTVNQSNASQSSSEEEDEDMPPAKPKSVTPHDNTSAPATKPSAEPQTIRIGRKSAANRAQNSASSSSEDDDNEQLAQAVIKPALDKPPPIITDLPNPTTVRKGRKSAAHQLAQTSSSSSEDEEDRPPSPPKVPIQAPADNLLPVAATETHPPIPRIGRKSAAHQDADDESSSGEENEDTEMEDVEKGRDDSVKAKSTLLAGARVARKSTAGRTASSSTEKDPAAPVTAANPSPTASAQSSVSMPLAINTSINNTGTEQPKSSARSARKGSVMPYRHRSRSRHSSIFDDEEIDELASTVGDKKTPSPSSSTAPYMKTARKSTATPNKIARKSSVTPMTARKSTASPRPVNDDQMSMDLDDNGAVKAYGFTDISVFGAQRISRAFNQVTMKPPKHTKGKTMTLSQMFAGVVITNKPTSSFLSKLPPVPEPVPVAKITGAEMPFEFQTLLQDIQNLKKNYPGTSQRLLFESWLSSSARGPRIDLIPRQGEEHKNNSPPFEFIYTDRVVYRKGVPKPTKRPGCGCTDRCEPGNQCLCWRQQRRMTPRHDGFAYNEEGICILPPYKPIFECHEDCGCPITCRNRQVGRGRDVEVDLQQFENKGWGVTSRKALDKGKFICLYAGELLEVDVGEARSTEMYDHDTLLGRTYIFDLDFMHISKFLGAKDFGTEGIMLISDTHAQPTATNPAPVPSAPAKGKGRKGKGRKKRKSKVPAEELESESDGECFQALYTVDAMHYGNIARFFNHSCDNNVDVKAVYVDDGDLTKPLIAFFTNRNIKAGEELCISYGDGSVTDADGEERGRIDGTHGGVDQKCLCGTKSCRGFMFTKVKARNA